MKIQLGRGLLSILSYILLSFVCVCEKCVIVHGCVIV